MDIAFRKLFTIEFETAPQIVGRIPTGFFRRTGIISGGCFEGDRLCGKALPGGGDWVTIRDDGVVHLDVRAMLETDKGDTIYMTYGGRLKSTPELDARLAAGETIRGDQFYFRTAVQFETAAEELLWLNDIVAFGIGHRRPEGPIYDVYELL